MCLYSSAEQAALSLEYADNVVPNITSYANVGRMTNSSQAASEQFIASLTDCVQSYRLEDYKKLLENYSAEDIAAALLKELSNDSEVKVTITPEKPLPYRGKHSGGHGRGSRSRSGNKNFKGKRNFDRKKRKPGFKIHGRKG